MDLSQMMKRLKLEDFKCSADIETLRVLCMAFASNIPFDTLDMFGGKRKIWHLPTIYESIVLKKRGGFCYELNGLLQWTLKRIGFELDLIKAYQHDGNDEFHQDSGHMALMVTLQNGEKWLTDIGWGGSCFVLPLTMKTDIEQPQPNGVYRIRKAGEHFAVEKKKQVYLKTEEDTIKFENKELKETVLTIDGEITQEWNIIYGFKLTPCQLEDYQAGHDHAQFESEFLTKNSAAVMQNEKQRKVLFNNLFSVKEYVNPETIKLVRYKKCSKDEMRTVLEQEFGISIDFDIVNFNYQD